MQKTILGHIDCPHCGEPAGMEIKHDKNGEPFGYCPYCNGGQLRVGGNPARVRAFVKRYPWAAKPGAAPVTVTGAEIPEQQPEKQPEIPVTVTEPEVPEPVQKPVRKKATFADALMILGVQA